MIDGIDLYKVHVRGQDKVGALVSINEGGKITNISVDGIVRGLAGGEIGGMVGVNGSKGEIDTSYSAANVTGARTNNMGNYVGGLVGLNSAQISNSYATGNVDGNIYVGGLVGQNENQIKNSYAIGMVSGGSDKGNLVGRSTNPSIIRKSYWDTSINTDIINDLNGKGKTTNQLQSPTTATRLYKSWSTTNWDFGNEAQYPVLKNNNGNLLAGQRLGLQSLELSNNAILLDDFSNKKYRYDMLIGNKETTTTLTATAADPQAEITLSTGDSVITLSNGEPSSEIDLALSDSQITIMVKANKREVIYTLKVTRWDVQIEDGTSAVSFYEDNMVELDSSLINQSTIPSATYTYRWTQTEGKDLLSEFETTTGTIGKFTIPTDYVGRDTSSSKAILKLEVTLSKEDKQLRSSAEIELTINKKDNGHITGPLEAPVLEGLLLTAPDLSTHNETDPDGGIDADTISYLWQRFSTGKWEPVSNTTMSNSYRIPQAVKDNTKYRVLIGYTDAQGYRSTATSISITYVDIDRDNNGLIEIETKAELDAMRHQPDGSGYKESAGATKITIGCPTNGCNGYELKAHIDLNPTTNTSLHENWQPIGSFDAIFEGNHYTIANLKIAMSTDDIGFFGKTTERAKIRNVGLLNIIEINGNNNIGGLIGFNQGKVANSYVIAKTIEGNSMVGGLIGFNSNAIITKSYAIVKEIIGEGSIGGLIGKTSGGEISNSYAKVDGVKENGSSVCQSGRLIDKLIGNNEEANSSNIVESEMAGGCNRLYLFK